MTNEDGTRTTLNDETVVDSVHGIDEEQMEIVPDIVQVHSEIPSSEIPPPCSEVLNGPVCSLRQWNTTTLPGSPFYFNSVSLELVADRHSRYKVMQIASAATVPSSSPRFSPPLKPPDKIVVPSPTTRTKVFVHLFVVFLDSGFVFQNTSMSVTIAIGDMRRG